MLLMAFLGIATGPLVAQEPAYAGPRASVAPSTSALTLEQVLHAVVPRHPLVEAAAARLRAAQGSRRTAGALPNPFFTWQVENAGFPGRPTPAGLVTETSMFATLPLEPLWQRWSRVSGANATVSAAAAELALARRDVALNAARAFFRVALAQVAVGAAADIQDGLDSLVRFNRARVAEGAAAEGDLIRVEVERDRASTERALEEMELARARAELFPYFDDTTRAGTALTITVSTDDSAAARPPLPALDVMTARALALRPDVTAARSRARAAAAETGFQRTLSIRQLGLTFGAKRTGGTSSMIAGLSLPIPLFDRNRGEIQRAGGEQVAAERELTWAERRASAEVAGAYQAARVLVAQMRRLQGSFLARAEESRRIALAAYQEGAVPLFQVIDATRTLADARTVYYRALFAGRLGLLELYAAAGLDLVDPGAADPTRTAAGPAPVPNGALR